MALKKSLLLEYFTFKLLLDETEIDVSLVTLQVNDKDKHFLEVSTRNKEPSLKFHGNGNSYTFTYQVYFIFTRIR